MSLPEYVTLNGTNYASAKLSEAARAQVVNVQVVDAELARLQQQQAIAQTARNAYVNALMAEIKAPAAPAETAGAVAAQPKKPRAPRKTASKV
ncbi:hypothetical protein SAMN05216344_110143 [Polaromonas sp. OV174]|uniref:DUF6447 family protein n=1 Tax=Polaromonas sp. OV174 TaxID=1855300 RepID=UPI0008E86D03|nr:DUF6447 family protein [Polaromonas sp. OV174]SFC17982.1 hypothetical protein SAMN05216344_110143 [Polaromonas sp. OV174]